MRVAFLPAAILNRPQEEAGLVLSYIYEMACRGRFRAELRLVRNFAVFAALLLVAAIALVLARLPLFLPGALALLAVVTGLGGALSYMSALRKRPSFDFLSKAWYAFDIVPFFPHGTVVVDSLKGEPLELVFVNKESLTRALDSLRPIKDTLAEESSFLQGLEATADCLKSQRREHIVSPFLQAQGPLTRELLRLPSQSQNLEGTVTSIPRVSQATSELVQKLAAFLGSAKEDKDFLLGGSDRLAEMVSQAKATLQRLYPLFPPPLSDAPLPAAAKEWRDASLKDAGHGAPPTALAHTIASNLEAEVRGKIDNIRLKSHLKPQEVHREYDSAIQAVRGKTVEELAELDRQRTEVSERQKQALKEKDEWQRKYDESYKLCEQAGDAYFGANKQVEQVRPELQSARLEYKTSTPGTDKETTARKQMTKVFEDMESYRTKGHQSKLEAALARQAMLEAQAQVEMITQHVNSAQLAQGDLDKQYARREQEGQQEVQRLEEERDAILEAIRLKDTEAQVQASLSHISQFRSERELFLRSISLIHQEVEQLSRSLDLAPRSPNTFDHNVLALKVSAVDALFQEATQQIDSAVKALENNLNAVQGYILPSEQGNLEGEYYVPVWCGAYRASPESEPTLVLLTPCNFEETPSPGAFHSFELKPGGTEALPNRLRQAVSDGAVREFLASHSLLSRADVLEQLRREGVPRLREARLISRYLSRALASFVKKRLAELEAPLQPDREKEAISTPALPSQEKTEGGGPR